MAKLEVMAKKGAILTTNSETGGVTMKVTESASSLGQVQPTQPVNSSQQQYRSGIRNIVNVDSLISIQIVVTWFRFSVTTVGNYISFHF